MKKYLVWIGAMILVMALTSPALAQDWAKQFTATSLFQIWSVAVNKQDFKMNAADQDITTKGISSRINFYLNWGDPKYVRGVIGFEADSTNWGEPAWSNTSTTTDPNYSGSANPSGRMGVRNTDQPQLEIKHAYLDFTVPNTPVSVAVGIQGFAYGGRLFQSQDAPGMKVTAAFAPHQIQAVWWRENEGYTTDTATLSRQSYHVNDYYGLEYKLSQKEFNVYAYGFYQNNLSNATYDENGYLIGVGGGFRPGNLNLSGQLVYLTGKRDYVTGTDVDVSAYAAELLAQYTIGPGLSVAAEGFYATGNDADNATKKKQYFMPAGSEAYSNFGLGRTVFFWMNFSEFGNQHQKQNDFGGMYYGRLNGQYSPLPWLNLSANYLYIGDTSKGTANGVKVVNSPTGARKDKDCDFIGHEINLITTLKIYQNFTYNIGLGYFLPGDVYDSATKSADNAWAVNTGMQLAF